MFVNVAQPVQTITVQIGSTQPNAVNYTLTLNEARQLRDKLSEAIAKSGA